MAQVCKVCTHPRRAEFLQQLCDQAATGKLAIQPLAKKFGVSRTALTNHIKTCIPATVASAARAGAVEQGVAAVELIEKYVRDAEQIRLACSEWMTDPDDPNRFSLEKRASEVMVIYLDGVRNGTPVRRKKSLAELLALVQQKLGIQVAGMESLGTDPRKLYLDLFRSATSLITLRANLWGEGKGKGDEDRRDWVGWLKGMAAESGEDVVELAKFCWEKRVESRAALEEEWPEVKGVH